MTNIFLNRSASARHDFFARHSELLKKLAHEGQRPEALFIGCSDARVTPESLLGAKPGDFFMLRVVGNVVPPYIQTEIGIASALEFAVRRLRVPHIIICGHTDCGGIRGLDEQMDPSQEPALSRWLALARPAQWEVDFYQPDLSPEARHIAIVEGNVLRQLRHLQSYPFVREAMAAEQLELHGWVYYLERPQLGYYDAAADKFVTLY
jgi:carbonic anhydrase